MTGLKIGVLTFHRCINYGSYWQARCLVEGLQARGHKAVLLDHQSGRVNMAEWKCAFQPTLPTPSPAADRPLYREKMERFFRDFEQLPLSPKFDLAQPQTMPHYDVIVVGSDEVWNLFHPWYGGNPLFYGEGLKADRIVSYAATFGNYPASWGLGAEWIERLQQFDAISIRDDNSQEILRNALGREVAQVLDPCLQFPIIPDGEPINFLETPYAAVYGHNFSDAFIREVRHWAAQRNLPLVSIGYRNDWADAQWLTAGPHDFAHFIAGAEAVATNFFHGCVFALRNKKPFVCETTPYRSIKVQGLMASVGGEAHLVMEDTPTDVYRARLNEPLNPKITEQIERLRHSSHAYLDQALRMNQLQVA